MSGYNKFVLIGIGWAALVLVTLLLAVPESRSAAVVFAFVGLVAGWLVAARRHAAVVGERSPHSAGHHDHEIVEHTIVAISRVSREYSLQLDLMRAELAQTRGILGEAIGQLIASFQHVNLQVQRQQRLSVQVVNPGAEIGHGAARLVGEFEAIAQELDAALGQAVISLQFQDVVSQLLGHVTRRLEVLEGIAADHEQLALVLRETSDPANTIRAIVAIREHVETLSLKLGALKQGVDTNPVSQTGYASGDVELF